MNQPLNFDEAVAFLKTTPSTLYKWLQAGKVPAHKMGRQWRFTKPELESFLCGKQEGHIIEADIKKLSRLFSTRDSRAGEEVMQNTISVREVSQQLIWDAVEMAASDIHIQPQGRAYSVKYRKKDGLEEISNIDSSTLEALVQEWKNQSAEFMNGLSRRMFMEKEQNGEKRKLQIRMQCLDTLQGRLITLRIFHDSRMVMDLEKICSDKKSLETFRRWSKAPKGLILVSGLPGSGKTSTLYSLLHEVIKDKGRVVYTIEDPIEFEVRGAFQVEVDLNDPAKYRDVFRGVFASDPDVLCLGSSFSSEQLPLIYKTALEAAREGHLVITQINGKSCRDAMQLFEKTVGEKIEDALLGVSCQKIVKNASGAGKTAEYEFLSCLPDGN